MERPGGELPSAPERLARAPVGIRARVVRSLTPPQCRELVRRWDCWAHPGQMPPPEEEDWRVWLMLAGRGFGKTRAGAEWVSALARADGSLRIALVGASRDEVRKVMIEGESGLLSVAREGEPLVWLSSVGVLRFHSGAIAYAYSGAAPEKLRGAQHHVAWCDELAKWRHADAAWDNLLLGLRLGAKQRVLVTTTPKPSPILRRIMAAPGLVVSRGGTADNPNLSKEFVGAMQRSYGGTRLGRQELEGELIDDVEGALWTRALIEEARVLQFGASTGSGAIRDERVGMKRVVVGVDPPASSHGDACGIVVAGLGEDGLGYVLADASVGGLSPDGWARSVAEAAEAWGADRVVAEANNGGEMVESVLRASAHGMPVKLVHASRGKAARAEPVAALFENGRAKFAGCFPELEDELAGITIGGGYEGPGRSPDRADAMVWAMTELILGPQRGEPRVRVL